jgi:NADPH:quinone reductase-like Zn-dependent oxidoreductase
VADVLAKEEKFDVIFDAVGGDRGWKLAQSLLTSNGTFVTACGNLEIGSQMGMRALGSLICNFAWKSIFSRKHYRQIMNLPLPLFPELHKLIQIGSLKPIVAMTLPLKQAVKAHQISDTLRSVGKTVFIHE